MLIPAEQWKPCTLDIIVDESHRDPASLLAVAQQFGVESQARYQPVRNPATQAIAHTWCNIYLWDATSALDAEIPHWVDDDGQPCAMGQGHETTANDVCDWLAHVGMEFGWAQCDAGGAVEFAMAGRPAVVVWKNPTGASGHVALVLPSPNPPDVLSAQAGAVNFVGRPYQTGFGDRPVLFYRHA